LSRIRYFFVAILCVALGTKVAVAQIDCSPLAPRGGLNVDINIEGRVKAEIDGIFRQIEGKLDVDGTYRKVISDVLIRYPNASHLYIWERLILLRCEMFKKSRGMSNEEMNRHFLDLVHVMAQGSPTPRPRAIGILNASWGHGSVRVDANTIAKLKTMCSGLESCTFMANKDYFGSVPGATEPYDLFVHYKCLPDGQEFRRNESNMTSVILTCIR